MMDQHLDSQTIGRWMAGDRAPAAQDHLHGCAECRAEVARLESALSHFRQSVAEWSDRQPLARPPARPASEWVNRRRRIAPLRWAAAAAAIALLAGPPVYREYSRREATERATADALLLQEVSADIARPAPQPLEPLIKLVSQSTTGDER